MKKLIKKLLIKKQNNEEVPDSFYNALRDYDEGKVSEIDSKEIRGTKRDKLKHASQKEETQG